MVIGGYNYNRWRIFQQG